PRQQLLQGKYRLLASGPRRGWQPGHLRDRGAHHPPGRHDPRRRAAEPRRHDPEIAQGGRGLSSAGSERDADDPAPVVVRDVEGPVAAGDHVDRTSPYAPVTEPARREVLDAGRPPAL